MTDAPTRFPSLFSRRVALAGVGAGGLGLALAGVARPAAAQEATPEIETTTGVAYGTADPDAQVLDVVRPTGPADPAPAVVLVHGGGLVLGPGRYEMDGVAKGLAQAGYAAFNIDYRLFDRREGTNPWPTQLDDAQRAVRWVRANAATYGVDPDRIGALGWSSGGQLAAFLGVRDTRDNSDPALAAFSSRAGCVVDLAGPMDLTIPYPYNEDDNRIVAEILGGTLDAPPAAAAYRDISPIAFVDETSAPFLIMQEGDDSVVPVAHSLRMLAALQAARVEVAYAWFPRYDHGSWGLWSNEAPETLAFLGRHLAL
jgi:acetyl esterase/lipase